MADFRLPLGDHSRRLGDQCGVAQLLSRIGQLRLGGFERALTAAQRGLGRIVFTAAGVALGQQLFLAHKGRAALRHPRLLGGDCGYSGIDVSLQILGIEFGQHLPRRDPVADIHHALNNLAADPERKLSLHTRLNIAGQRHLRGVIRRRDLLHVDTRQIRRRRLFLATASQDHQRKRQTNNRQS